MPADSVVGRYARALLDLATASDKVDAYAKDLGTFREAWTASAELRLVLTNPGIPLVERQAVVKAILDRLRVDSNVSNFVRLLVDRGRIDLVEDIAAAYSTQADAAAGRLRGVAAAPVKLNPMQLTKLNSAVSRLVARQVVLEAVVDENLLGGIRVEIGGRVFDGSVRGHLERIREQLT